jgi:hypothetical protein
MQAPAFPFYPDGQLFEKNYYDPDLDFILNAYQTEENVLCPIEDYKITSPAVLPVELILGGCTNPCALPCTDPLSLVCR